MPTPRDGFEDGEAAPWEVGIADVLDDVVVFIDRFMAMTAEQLDAAALWVAVTHAADQFDVCPYVHVMSATKRAGKSLLLDLLEHLVCRGRSTANISPAALYRMLEESRPTLLFDEIDNIFVKGRNADPAKAELVGLINAGWRKGRPAYRMGGANMRQLEEFDAYGPKALAGIGSCLPDTTADRTIPLRLERKHRAVTKERYRVRINEGEARALGERIGSAVSTLDNVGSAWPELPFELNDRQQDVWEPLLAIADAAGKDWPERARRAARSLHRDGDESDTTGMHLLADIRTVFIAERMLTKHLVGALNGIDESPWGDWRNGQGLSSSQLVTMLSPFGVKSKPVRVDANRGRGFERHQFVDVFDRYLAEPNADAVDTVDNPGEPQVTAVNGNGSRGVDATVDALDLHERAVVNTVNTDNDTHPNGDTLTGPCAVCTGRTGLRTSDGTWACSRHRHSVKART